MLGTIHWLTAHRSRAVATTERKMAPAWGLGGDSSPVAVAARDLVGGRRGGHCDRHRAGGDHGRVRGASHRAAARGRRIAAAGRHRRRRARQRPRPTRLAPQPAGDPGRCRWGAGRGGRREPGPGDDRPAGQELGGAKGGPAGGLALGREDDEQPHEAAQAHGGVQQPAKNFIEHPPAPVGGPGGRPAPAPKERLYYTCTAFLG